MRFDERVVVVSGAAHGIGKATVARFLSEGARVAGLDVDVAALQATIAELDPAGERTTAVECDVTRVASVQAAVDQVRSTYGRIDVLASVAGGDVESDEPEGEDHWQRIVELNLNGPARLVRQYRPLLARGSSIVLVGSVNGLVAAGGTGYSSAKAGLGLMAKNLAVSLGPEGVRINVVAPGTVRTRVWSHEDGGADRMQPWYPLGRVGEPADIAAAIAFLASEDAAWITGITLPVDGGFTAGPLVTLAQSPGMPHE